MEDPLVPTVRDLVRMQRLHACVRIPEAMIEYNPCFGSENHDEFQCHMTTSQQLGCWQMVCAPTADLLHSP